MRTLTKWIVPLFVMAVVSMLMLISVSVLAYIYKWYADKALLGVTLTYIIAGFVGGRVLKRLSEVKDMNKKLLESIFLGVLAMALLVLFSLLVTDNAFGISSRFLMIWMLITGSASLGRIL